MATATITFGDDETSPGKILISADFGEAVDDASVAHATATFILQELLKEAKTVETLSDTTGDAPITKTEPEPSRIILPNG